MFDSTIHLGDVLMMGSVAGSLLFAYHKWDKKIDMRHLENNNAISKIDTKIDSQSLDIKQRVDRVENKIDENTRTTNGINARMIDLGVTVEKHITADDIVQKEMLRRIDRIDK